MQISNPVTKDGILEEMDRICGSDAVTFPVRDKISRINDAQNKYFSLAFEGDGRYNFDDIRQTSSPIDTQNLVSGTNSYKLSDFTQKIYNVIRVSALNDNAEEIDLQPEFMEQLPDSFTQTYKTSITGVPWRYLRYGDFIYIRETPSYNETDGLRIYFDRPAMKFTFTTFTVTQANPGVFTSTAHGLSVGDTVIFDSNDTIPSPLLAGTNYYIKTVPTADTFTVATISGGTALEITDNQATGTHVWLKTNVEPGILEPHGYYLARKASIAHLKEKKLSQINQIKEQVFIDERDILDYFSNRDEDIRPKATTKRILHR